MEGERFDVLLTVDRNLRHQQNLARSGVAIVVLVAASNRLADLKPLVPLAMSALSTIGPGDVVEISV